MNEIRNYVKYDVPKPDLPSQSLLPCPMCGCAAQWQVYTRPDELFNAHVECSNQHCPIAHPHHMRVTVTAPARKIALESAMHGWQLLATKEGEG